MTVLDEMLLNPTRPMMKATMMENPKDNMSRLVIVMGHLSE
jgi:hypothetical protein